MISKKYKFFSVTALSISIFSIDAPDVNAWTCASYAADWIAYAYGNAKALTCEMDHAFSKPYTKWAYSAKKNDDSTHGCLIVAKNELYSECENDKISFYKNYVNTGKYWHPEKVINCGATPTIYPCVTPPGKTWQLKLIDAPPAADQKKSNLKKKLS